MALSPLSYLRLVLRCVPPLSVAGGYVCLKVAGPFSRGVKKGARVVRTAGQKIRKKVRLHVLHVAMSSRLNRVGLGQARCQSR